MSSPATPTTEPQVSESRLLRSARWALYATFAGLPLYVVRWSYGPLPTTLLETLIIVTVVLYVVAAWRGGRRRPVTTGYEIPIVMLLVAGAIAVFVARDHRGALGLYRAFFIEPIALFYVAVDLLRVRVQLQRLVVGFAAGSSTFALLNLFVFVQALVAHSVNVGYAPTAVYGDPNYVAMYLEPPFALAAGFVLLAHGRWKLASGIWLLIVGAALVATFSKGSYLALVVLVMVAAITAPRWRLPLTGAMIVAAIATTQVPLLMSRLATIPSSLGGRGEIFGATLGMLREHPLFGLGIGGYSYQFRGVAPEPYPHDIWLTFWVETGVLGAIAFALILAGLLWRGWRAWPHVDGTWRPMLWGVLGAFVLWTVHGLVDSPYWKNDMSAEFWILAAVEVVALRAMRVPVAAWRIHPS